MSDPVVYEIDPEGLKTTTIRTSCRECIFAKITVRSGEPVIGAGSTQEGCYAGVLDKFDADDVKTEHSEDGHDSYKVIDRFCTMCRNEDWLKSKELARHEVKKAHEIARKEASLQCSVVIHFDEFSKLTDLEETVDSLIEQDPQPKLVIAVLTGTSIRPTNVLTTLKRLKCEVLVETVYDTEGDDRYVYPILWAQDLAVRRCKGEFYSYCLAGHTYPDNFFNVLDRALNDEMVKFLYVKPCENGNGGVVSILLHRRLDGNKGKPTGPKNLYEKLQHVAEAEKCEHLIQSFPKLCQKLR